jgi:prevent-host-death family protein
MKQVNLYEAKTSLSCLVEEAANGEEIVIAKNGKALARLVPLEGSQPRREPKFGTGAHLGWVMADNFDTWDQEMEDVFYPVGKLLGEL